MTRRSGRQQKRSENVPEQKNQKRRSRKKLQPLTKLQCEQNQLVPEGVAEPHALPETPEKNIRDDFTDAPVALKDSSLQASVLPLLRSSDDVWMKMVSREQNNTNSSSFMQKHPRIQPRMRSILLDWLIEVSEEYALHRQTFYLAQDFFDRFMMTQSNVEKNLLQLIGITCLFIASKLEEACPPKLSQMAFITAGTFYEDEILQMELIILKALRWNLCPETSLSWLKLYFQMASMNSDSDLLESQFPQEDYIQMTRLLDLCVLDINSLNFECRVLAASVLRHFVQPETVEKVSGLSKDVTQPCVTWMTPFIESLSRSAKVALRDFKRVKEEDRHNIQTHTDYLSMLDAVSLNEVNSEFPTPPSSTEKLCSR